MTEPCLPHLCGGRDSSRGASIIANAAALVSCAAHDWFKTTEGHCRHTLLWWLHPQCTKLQRQQPPLGCSCQHQANTSHDFEWVFGTGGAAGGTDGDDSSEWEEVSEDDEAATLAISGLPLGQDLLDITAAQAAADKDLGSSLKVGRLLSSLQRC